MYPNGIKKNKQKSVSIKKSVQQVLCKHNYIRTDGIITCSNCDMKALLYLTPLTNN